ncbi:MAG TPA: universal stress protein [Woeseiaceae bacterium]|nr:universal stress protein [Woeseiaceae bacterium]
MYKKILVPVDGSVASVRGLEEAIEFAQATGATLALVHVVDEFVIAAREAPAVWQGLAAALRESGEKVLADAEAAVRKHNVPFTSELLKATGGGAAGAIIDQAKKMSTDLIVMGTHGRRGLRRLTLGSDAEMVLRSSPVPVLMVRDEVEPS